MTLKALFLITALVVSFLFGHHLAEVEQQASRTQALEQAQEREHELVLTVNDIATQLQKAKEDAQTHQNTLTAGIRAGTVRLSIPTAVCGGESPTAASGNKTETRTELDRPTAEALVSITTDGDNAIRQLNACIDTYNKVTK
jgi:prophage endopeptidase